MFEYYAVKIVLGFFICSGILYLLGGAYLGFTKRGGSRSTKPRHSWSEMLLRGISTEVLSLVAYGVFRKALFQPWHILFAFMLVSGVTELLIVRTLRPLFTASNQ